MPATIHAHSSASRTLIPFSVKLRTAGRALHFTALARSSGEAFCNALAMPDLAPPIAASVRPLSTR